MAGKGKGVRIELSGKKFGRLTAIRFSHVHGRHSKWVFLCDCGRETTTFASLVKGGSTKSCGCLLVARRTESRKTHGFTLHLEKNKVTRKFYATYQGAKNRCTNKNDSKKYASYGGRGIKFLWKNFESFRDDMYEPYMIAVKEHGITKVSIDRIDNDGPYSKENCRWVTSKSQQNNKRNTRLFHLDGEQKTFMQICSEYGISESALRHRIREGMDIKSAVTKPIRKTNRLSKINIK